MRSGFLIAAGVAVAIGVPGCAVAGGTDKAGSPTTVLQFASIDEVNDNGQSFGPQAFIDSLARLSGGRMKVHLLTDNYEDGDPRAETDLVTAIAHGDLDGGWPATRAFARAGMTGLEAVEAPMTVTSYAAEKALVSGPVATKLLATLDGTGFVGLGLAVGPLRRPFAAKSPLLAPEDWKGKRFRVFNSPVQSEAIQALGATPVNLSFEWIDQVRIGTLGGGESDLAQYAKNGNSTEAGEVTSNLVLWPKVFVLGISRKRFDALTEQQQGWVRTAAESAAQASVNATYDENALAQQLCAKGVRFRQASPGQLANVRTALRPVLARLAADPTTGPLLRDIQAIAARHPQPDVPASTGDCPAADSGGIGAIPATRSTLPDGVYRVALTAEDVAAAGFSNANGITGTWTLTITNGTYQVTCRPLDLPGSDCGNDVSDAPFEVGDLRGNDHTVYFVGVPERLAAITGCLLPAGAASGHCAPSGPYRAEWAVNADKLTFSEVRMGCECDNLSIKPWRKIG